MQVIGDAYEFENFMPENNAITARVPVYQLNQ
jgi:hypothetical protein